MLPLLMGWLLIHGCAKEEAASVEKGGKKMVVKEGDRVQVLYEGTLNDGTVFDKSEPGEPLEFTVGGGQIIPGFEQAVRGMKQDEEKKVTIKPEDAYGDRNESLIREFPRSSLPAGFKAEKGMVIRLQDPQGRAVPATITDIGEENLTIDLNHPLAGEELTFDITVVKIE
ncbi:MAG: peptidylprolyl isomerase [Fidelibacterota bacterium]